MENKSYYLTQAMDKVASPILNAIDNLSSSMPSSSPSTSKEVAEKTALLLTKSTQLSISIFNAMDIKNCTESEADNIRMALTSISSPIISHQYKLSGKIPDDQDLEKSISSLRTIIPFAENFSDFGSISGILKTMDGSVLQNNKNIMALMFLKKLSPAINIINDFPFGQAPQKLFQDVSSRLINDAKNIQKETIKESNEEDIKLAELSIIDSLVDLYCQSHQSEKDKLVNNPSTTNLADINNVWKVYEERKAMLILLAQNLVPEKLGTSSPVGNIKPTSPTEMPPASNHQSIINNNQSQPNQEPSPVPEAPIVSPPSPVVAPEPKAPAADNQPSDNNVADDNPSGDSSNPMSFFSGKSAKKEDGE